MAFGMNTFIPDALTYASGMLPGNFCLSKKQTNKKTGFA